MSIFNPKRKTLILICIVIFVAFGMFTYFNRDIVFQEGNPFPVVSAVTKLTFSDAPYVQFSSEPTKYIAHTRSSKEANYALVKEYMKAHDFSFKQQLGSTLVFENEKEQSIVSTRQYTKHYFIWTMPETSELASIQR